MGKFQGPSFNGQFPMPNLRFALDAPRCRCVRGAPASMVHVGGVVVRVAALFRGDEQGEDHVAEAAGHGDGEDHEYEDAAEMAGPVGEAEGGDVEDGGGAADEDVRGAREVGAAPDGLGAHEPDAHAHERERQDEHGVLEKAPVEGHVRGGENHAAEVRHYGVADAADAERPDQAREHGLEQIAVVAPEHGGGGDGAEERVDGMEDVEGDVRRFFRHVRASEDGGVLVVVTLMSVAGVFVVSGVRVPGFRFNISFLRSLGLAYLFDVSRNTRVKPI